MPCLYMYLNYVLKKCSFLDVFKDVLLASTCLGFTALYNKTPRYYYENPFFLIPFISRVRILVLKMSVCVWFFLVSLHAQFKLFWLWNRNIVLSIMKRKALYIQIYSISANLHSWNWSSICYCAISYLTLLHLTQDFLKLYG